MVYTVTESAVVNVKADVLKRLHNNDKENIINIAIDLILQGVHVELTSKATGLSVKEILTWYVTKH